MEVPGNEDSQYHAGVRQALKHKALLRHPLEASSRTPGILAAASRSAALSKESCWSFWARWQGVKALASGPHHKARFRLGSHDRLKLCKLLEPFITSSPRVLFAAAC